MLLLTNLAQEESLSQLASCSKGDAGRVSACERNKLFCHHKNSLLLQIPVLFCYMRSAINPLEVPDSWMLRYTIWIVQHLEVLDSRLLRYSGYTISIVYHLEVLDSRLLCYTISIATTLYVLNNSSLLQYTTPQIELTFPEGSLVYDFRLDDAGIIIVPGLIEEDEEHAERVRSRSERERD